MCANRLIGEGQESLNERDYIFVPKGSSLAHVDTEARVPPDYVAPRVLTIGLFDGIGGLTVAWRRVPVKVLGMDSCEVDSNARRLMRRRWPGLIE